MRGKQKYLVMWLFSFVILFIDFIIFMFCFYYEMDLRLYVICAIVFTAFCICFSYSNKRIMCEDGYNLMQAYLFFKKCKKNGVHKSLDKLTKKHFDFISELASEYDYSKDFDLEKSKKLYGIGYEVNQMIKKEIRDRSKNL